MNARSLKAKEKKQQALCAAWTYPVGTAVTVRRDNGSIMSTRTQSGPWMLGGMAVIKVEGISGGFALERVRPSHP